MQFANQLWQADTTGKSVIKESLKQLSEKEYLVATVARTLHTYTALSDFPLTSRGQGHQVTGELDDFLWERPTGGDRR